MKKIIILIFLLTFKTSSAIDLVLYKDVISYDTIKYSKVSYDVLLSIFTKKQKFWENGEKITVFIKPINSVEHSVFIQDWLGISVYRYKKILKRQIYSGQTGNVREVLSDAEMIRSIMITPFSIGYLTDGTLLYTLNNPNDIHEIEVIYYD